jgi:RHS repeat-associated protein
VEDEAGDSANRFGFTGHELDSESGLYYAKARYYDPFVGLFLSEDPLLGDPLTPLSLHRYLYAYQNPLVYIDPDGEESISTLIDQAAEDCGVLGCAGYALLKGLYHVATAGFATVHDPIADARDAGRVTTDQYLKYGVGGGLAVTAVSTVTARAGGALVAGTTGLAGRTATSAVVGALSASAEDAVSQGSFIGSGLQGEFSLSQNLKVAGTGAAIGGTSAGVGHVAASRRVRHTQEVEIQEGSQYPGTEITESVPNSLAPKVTAASDDLLPILNRDFIPNGTIVELITQEANRRGFTTARNQAIFWSGLGRDGAAKLKPFVRVYGGTPVELTPGGAYLHDLALFGPDSPVTISEAMQIWANASRQFARGASGQVRTVIGPVKPSSIYRTVELPELRMNPNVIGIDEVPIQPRIEIGR